jgi:hypothetical protein
MKPTLVALFIFAIVFALGTRRIGVRSWVFWACTVSAAGCFVIGGIR